MRRNHINKCNDMNMNTRKMHITWAWKQARTLSHSLMWGHMHLVAHVLSPVMSSMYTCVSPLVHPSLLLRPFSSLSCTSSSTLSSTTRSPWKTCALPRTKGVTTPVTFPSPSQVMSPTTWPSASSTTLQVPSPTLPIIEPGHRRHYARQAAHRSTPITAIQKACQSVSRRCLSRETCGRKRCRSINWFWCHEKDVKYSQQVFWKHPSWEIGR